MGAPPIELSVPALRALVLTQHALYRDTLTDLVTMLTRLGMTDAAQITRMFAARTGLVDAPPEVPFVPRPPMIRSLDAHETVRREVLAFAVRAGRFDVAALHAAMTVPPRQADLAMRALVRTGALKKEYIDGKWLWSAA